jgi:hypothetical protein
MFSKTRITILALTGAIAMTGVAEGASKDKLTIKGPNGDFQGTIKAKKRKCMKNRAVHVYMLTDEGAQEIGSDTSELNADKTRGLWSIGNSGYKNGKFYATVDAKGHCMALKSKTVTVVTPDAEEPVSARTVGGRFGSKIPTVVTTTATALEVDGVPGGYSRQHCERLLQEWNDDVDKAVEDNESGNGQGPEAEAAASHMKDAQETYDDMSDNCLIVD